MTLCAETEACTGLAWEDPKKLEGLTGEASEDGGRRCWRVQGVLGQGLCVPALEEGALPVGGGELRIRAITWLPPWSGREGATSGGREPWLGRWQSGAWRGRWHLTRSLDHKASSPSPCPPHAAECRVLFRVSAVGPERHTLPTPIPHPLPPSLSQRGAEQGLSPALCIKATLCPGDLVHFHKTP